jgi:hypothetical protein
VLLSNEEHFHVSGIPWPVCSLDLTALDFFLWGYLKECIYRNRPRTAHELKHAIWDEIATINQELSCQVFDNFVNHFMTRSCK